MSADLCTSMRALGLVDGHAASSTSDSMMATPNEVLGVLSKNSSLVQSTCDKLAAVAMKEGKKAEPEVVNALGIFEAMANELMFAAEPYLCKHLPIMLTLASHKLPSIRDAATTAATAVTSKCDPNAVPELLQVLFEAMEPGKGWQTRVLALKIMESFDGHAPEQLGQSLPEVVPQLTAAMSDAKKEVKEAVGRFYTCPLSTHFAYRLPMR